MLYSKHNVSAYLYSMWQKFFNTSSSFVAKLTSLPIINRLPKKYVFPVVIIGALFLALLVRGMAVRNNSTVENVLAAQTAPIGNGEVIDLTNMDPAATDAMPNSQIAPGTQTSKKATIDPTSRPTAVPNTGGSTQTTNTSSNNSSTPATNAPSATNTPATAATPAAASATPVATTTATATPAPTATAGPNATPNPVDGTPTPPTPPTMPPMPTLPPAPTPSS